MTEDLYTQVAHNRNRLALVLAIFIAILLAVSWLVLSFFHGAISPPFNLWVTFALFWLVYLAYAVSRYFYGGRWLYNMVETLPPWKTDYRLRDALNSALLAEGMDRKVRIFNVPHSAINAFTLALPDGSFALFATQGMADKLPQEELQAVMAHELGHVRTGDTRMNTFFLRLAGRRALNLKTMGTVGIKPAYAFEAEEAPVLMELQQMAIERTRREIHEQRMLRRRYPQAAGGPVRKFNTLNIAIFSAYDLFFTLLAIKVVGTPKSEAPWVVVLEFSLLFLVYLSLLLFILPLLMDKLFGLAVNREREYFADLWSKYLTRDPQNIYNAIKMTAEDVHDVLVLHPSLDPLLFHPVVSYTSYQSIQSQPSCLQRLEHLRRNFPQDLL